ncbi:hypothetical protein JB92DRAFT_1253441 [Gautieria morchelliformis]|nr:hypothetical protein JB92DRAFT_1253441 [Gautieria morchelliformis]
MPQTLSAHSQAEAHRARQSDQRTVLCACRKCRLLPDRGLEGRMITMRLKRAHEKRDTQQRALSTDFQGAVKSRPKSNKRGVHSTLRNVGRSQTDQPRDQGEPLPESMDVNEDIYEDAHEELGQISGVDRCLTPHVEGSEHHYLHKEQDRDTAAEGLDVLFDEEANEAVMDDHLDDMWIYDAVPSDVVSIPGSPSGSSDTSSHGSSSHGPSSHPILVGHASSRSRITLGPLSMPSPPPDTMDAFQHAHEHWFVRCILLLVGFLHTKHHLSFRACGLLLWCLRFIFISLGLLASDDNMVGIWTSRVSSPGLYLIFHTRPG